MPVQREWLTFAEEIWPQIISSNETYPQRKLAELLQLRLGERSPEGLDYTLAHFWVEQQKWSYETFGPPSYRGPEGPLQHLLKELTQEILGVEVVETRHIFKPRFDDIEEFVNCIFLLFDAIHRAGFTFTQVVIAAWAKLRKNKNRRWKPWQEIDPKLPSEHIRDGEQPPE